jgi:hypothetical protein
MHRLTKRTALPVLATACLSLPLARAADRDYGRSMVISLCGTVATSYVQVQHPHRVPRPR